MRGKHVYLISYRGVKSIAIGVGTYPSEVQRLRQASHPRQIAEDSRLLLSGNFVSRDRFAHVLHSDEADRLRACVYWLVLPHVMLELLAKVVDRFLLAHGLVIRRVVKNLNDISLEKLLVLANALDEQNPEAHV